MSELSLESAAPMRVEVPSLARYGKHRLYRDVQDRNRLRVDALEPRLRTAGHGLAPSSIIGCRPARPVCVACDPDESTLTEVEELFTESNAVPMDWDSGPFFAWVRKAGGVTVLDYGESTNERGHEIHVCGIQPKGVELARAMAAIELVTWGRLCGVTLEASAVEAVSSEVMELARVGRRALWASTLGDALAAALLDLLRRERLRITVVGQSLPSGAVDEIRELVIMEWAHRLAGSHPLSLPAALVSGLVDEREIDMSIDWRDAEPVPLRVVRSLLYESIASDSVQSLSWGLSGGRAERAAAGA